jgi:hypothetical protein
MAIPLEVVGKVEQNSDRQRNSKNGVKNIK